MPYTKKLYGSKEEWKKYKRCVRKLKKKSTVESPYGVCRVSIYGRKKKWRK